MQAVILQYLRAHDKAPFRLIAVFALSEASFHFKMAIGATNDGGMAETAIRSAFGFTVDQWIKRWLTSA